MACSVLRNLLTIAYYQLNGDGRCDIIYVDKATGAFQMFRNDYSNGVFKFTELGYVNGTAICTEGYGVGQHDLGVVFADVSILACVYGYPLLIQSATS